MEFLKWLTIGIFVIALLYGLFQWLGMFLWSWVKNGKTFTFKLIILFILFIIPGITNSYAPELFGISIWILIVYSLFLVVMRFTKRSEEG